jgi:nuclear cap-binding protein subunit 1
MTDQIPPVLAECIDRIFERIPQMDRECRDRFSDWFSLHLSNFDFRWDWNSWRMVLTHSSEHHHQWMFISEVRDINTVCGRR